MGEIIKHYAYRLFDFPSFWEGIARMADPWGALDSYHTNKYSEEADKKAILSDWQAVGQDMSLALKEYERQQSKQPK